MFSATKGALYAALFVAFLFGSALSQSDKKSPKPPARPTIKITQVDEVALAKLLVPNGKPLLVNFWATWCEPCREEFPDLVKLDGEFKGRIDFITVSLDDPAELQTSVPRFLASMKAEMPAYLLKTADESTVIRSVSKAWNGGMPFTILYDAKGAAVYEREGKVDVSVVRPQIEMLLDATTSSPKSIG